MKSKKKYPKLEPARLKWDGDRIVGCQSANHSACKGELWECARCHKIICWEEGHADDLPEFCDDCWYDVRVLGQELTIGSVSVWRFPYETT